jgi:hypothetical protein
MKASETRFGVEIECFVPANTNLTVGSYHHGQQIEWLPAGWNAQSDSSLGAARPGYKAVEIVSPPICGEQGLVDLVAILDIIKSIGGYVLDSCGLHVHVDASRLQYGEVARIADWFTCHEKAFYALNGTHAIKRERSVYCQPSMAWKFKGEPGKAIGHGDRYQSLNFTNLYLRPQAQHTLEVRVFSGTLEAETVITAVYMAVGLIVAAVNAAAAPVTARFDDYNAAARQFTATVWNREENLIVPDADVEDLEAVLFAQARLAVASQIVAAVQ